MGRERRLKAETRGSPTAGRVEALTQEVSEPLGLGAFPEEQPSIFLC